MYRYTYYDFLHPITAATQWIRWAKGEVGLGESYDEREVPEKEKQQTDVISPAFYQVHETGFFSVVGTGFAQEEVDRQYDIGQAYFDLPLKEKGDARYRCDFAQGNYFGYRAVRTPPQSDNVSNML